MGLVLRDRHAEVLQHLRDTVPQDTSGSEIKDKEAFFDRLESAREERDFQFRVELAKAEQELSLFVFTD